MILRPFIQRSMKKVLVPVLFLGMIVACSPPDPLEPVATWGDQSISVGELKNRFQIEVAEIPEEVRQKSAVRERVLRQTLEEMIDHRLLLRAALQAGTSIDEAELDGEIRKHKSRYTEWNFQQTLKELGIKPEAWREQKREKMIIQKYLDHLASTQSPITQEDVKGYYEAHPEEFRREEAVRVRQIVTDSKEKAEAILRRLRKGENFAKLAGDLSLSPDRKQGGDLGFIIKGTFPREFELCFSMNPGEISPIIPSAYGFHLFKVLEKRPEAAIPLKEVEGKIALKLKQEARQAEREAVLQETRAQEPVVIHEKVLTRIQ